MGVFFAEALCLLQTRAYSADELAFQWSNSGSKAIVTTYFRLLVDGI